MVFCQSQTHESLSDVREMAFQASCDILQHFGQPMAEDTEMCAFDRAGLQPLVYTADDTLCSSLLNFVMHRCFIDVDNEDQRLLSETQGTDDEVAAKIEIVHKRRTLLSGFAQLIIYRRIPMIYGASVFGHYIKAFSDYGDVIRLTISKCRELSQIECAKSLAVCLTNVSKFFSC